MTLKQKTVSGVKWVAISRYAGKFLTVVSFIILARILEPRDFGLFAMAFIVIDGFNLFKNFGIDTALVQRKKDTDLSSHTAFFILPVLGILIFTLLYFTAPLCAKLLNEAALTSVLRTLGLIFVIGCIGSVPAALLRKELRFKEVALRDLVSCFFYCLISILLAFLGFGVWSLVYGYIAQRLIWLSLTWVVSGYKPKLIFNGKIALQLIGFGKFILGTSVLWFLLANIDKTVAGRILGTAMLGYYALAFNISSLTYTHLSQIIDQVMFPSYSKIQDDRDGIRRIFLKIFKTISIFCIPFGIGLMLFAPEFIRAVYGQKWIAAVPALRILAICSLILPLSSGTRSIFLSCGKPKWNFILGFLELAVLGSIIVPLTRLFGLIGVAVSVTFAKLAFTPLSYIWTKRLINITLRDLWQMLRASVFGSAIMVIMFLILKLLMNLYLPYFSINLLSFVSLLLFGAGIYFLFFFISDKNTLLELKRLVCSWG